jgi:outer membrane protein TolC
VQQNDRLQQIGADSFVKNYSVNMDQLLWDGGRLSMSRNLERMDLNIANARLQRVAVEIAEIALAAYRSVLSTRAILDIRKTALESLCEQLRILEQEVELGLALPIDLWEATLALAQARIEIVSLETDLVEMEMQFADLLGLQVLPELEESIDIHRPALLPSPQASASLAEEKNPDLAQARYSISRRQIEYRYASRSWIPAFRLNGSFTLSGQDYPLSRHAWSVGVTVDFSNPWLQNTFAFQTGWESMRDRTAQLQNSASLLPDPAASLGKKQAQLALALEREKYALAFERTGRVAALMIEKCRLLDRRRSLAVEALDIAARRCGLEEIRLGLGQITRLELMQAHIAYTEREIAAVESTIALMNAQRELESLLDLRPGELAAYARSSNAFSTGDWP